MPPINDDVAVRLPLLADRLFDVPLLIHGRKLRAVVAAMAPGMGISGYLTPELAAAVGDDFLVAHDQPVAPGVRSIAVIPVHGTLVQRGGGIDALFGLRSYESIREDLRAALDDDSVAAILFDIDSGGGEVSGCFDLVDEIFAAREKKRIYAFAHEHAYSAAYAIASAAEKIYMPRTGGVGSIGVVGVHLDQSGWDKKNGLVFTPVYAGDRKIDGWPHGALSDDALAAWQDSIDFTYRIFTETVARNRGIDVAAVVATQAGCYGSGDAIDNGLADAVATMDDVIEIIWADVESGTARDSEISRNGSGKADAVPDGVSKASKGVSKMALKKLLQGKRRAKAETPTGDDEEDIKGVDDERDEDLEDEDDESAEGNPDEESEGYDGADDEEELEDDEDEETAESARAQAADIVDMCVLAGKPRRAARYIRNGMSLADVQKDLLSRQNADSRKGAARPIKSAQTGRPAKAIADGQRLSDDMKRRFGGK